MIVIFKGCITYAFLLVPGILYGTAGALIGNHILDFPIKYAYFLGHALPSFIFGFWAWRVNRSSPREPQQTLFWMRTEIWAVVTILIFGALHWHFDDWQILRFFRELL